ncbi:MAG: phage tail protein [Bacteroidetes bacterium]|nr:phage tail protein [Bacteroidota bacterium]
MTANLNELKVADAENAVWSEPTIGQIAMFAGNFAPRGWAFCDGSLLPINSNSALFSILGTTYGGDGRTTFGLPDLRGRVAVGAGHGPGLSPVQLGEKFGREQMNIIPQTVSVDASTGNNDKMVVSGILPANNVMQPSLSVNYIIALTGVFPSRS